MINFFRKIRQKIILESKLSKYLIYASGEIVLVAIGILMALQINNWNGERKADIEEIVILKNLLESLNSAKKQSNIEILEENHLKESLLLALGLESDKIKPNKTSITDSLFLKVVWDANPSVPVLSSYSDIKNTGKIGIIKNREIREDFTNLELVLTELRSLVKDRLTLQQIRIDEIIVNDMNFVRMLKSIDSSINVANESQNNYNSILNHQEVRNALALKLSLTYSAIEHRQELEAKIDDLIELVVFELK